GAVATTYLNATYHQISSGLTPAWAHQFFIDDVLKFEVTEPANSSLDLVAYTLNAGPYNIHGGRHTLKTVVDPANAIVELNETDNTSQAQFLWSPNPTGPGTFTLQNAPPAAGNLPQPNLDGFYFTHDASSAWVIGMATFNTADDYLFRIYG